MHTDAAVLSATTAVVAMLLLLPVSTPDCARPATWARWLPVPGAVALFFLAGTWLVPAVVLGGAVAWARVLWGRHLDSRRARDRAGRVVEVCDLLAAELRAGRPPPAALEDAADACPEVRPAADAARLGGDVPAALRAASGSPGAAGLSLLAGAWAVSHRTGAGLADSTWRVAEAVRTEQETSRVVAGELASARSTARLVAALPVVALMMGSGAGASPWHFLLATPPGVGCLAGGLAATLAGLWWIEALSRGVVR